MTGKRSIAITILVATLAVDIGLHVAFFLPVDFDLPLGVRDGATGSISGRSQVVLSTIGLVMCIFVMNWAKVWVTILVIARIWNLMSMAGFALSSDPTPEGYVLRIVWSIFYIGLLVIAASLARRPDDGESNYSFSVEEVGNVETHFTTHTQVSSTSGTRSLDDDPEILAEMMQQLNDIGFTKADGAMNVEIIRTQDGSGTTITVRDKNTGQSQTYANERELPPELRRLLKF